MVLVSLSSALFFSRNRRPCFTHGNDENDNDYDKASNRHKSSLTMTVNTGRLRQATNSLPNSRYSLDHEGHEYVSVIIVAALQKEQSTPKVLHPNRTRLTKLTVEPRYICRWSVTRRTNTLLRPGHLLPLFCRL